MCGIIGVIKASTIEQRQLQQAIKVLGHRGPDGSGSWIAPDGKVALGHARLSLVDLEHGQQPLHAASQDVVAVVNGEIYGHRELRGLLAGKGYQFKTASDSEVLLALYLEQGTACLQSLRGEFAFIIWDGRKQQLFAGRDRFGVKPLFYHQDGDDLYLASEIKALLALGVEPRWDVQSVYDFDAGILHNDRSFFRGVKQLPPGHFLLASTGHVRTVGYWDTTFATQATLAQDKRSPQDYVEPFKALFADAVRLRLDADVPVGCYLSGGLDSCSILGMANALAGKPLDAFTISFNDGLYDEFDMAREMADFTGSRLHRVDVSDADLATHFDQAVWHAESLFINPHGVAKFLLSKAVRAQGLKAVLTGEGADEILAGYPIFRQDLLMSQAGEMDREELERKLDALKLANKTSIGLLLSEESGSEHAFIRSLLGYVPAQLAGSIRRFKLYSSFYRPEFLSMMQGRDSIAAFLDGLDVSRQLKGRDEVNQSLYLWNKTSFPNYMLSVLGDRMEMAHSIEGRPPFLDHALAEFCAGIPVSQKIHLEREKHLLRSSVRELIPQSIFDRQKQPFMAPAISRASHGALQAFVCDMLNSSTAQDLPFYDNRKLLALINNIPNLPANVQAGADALLIQVASACSLQKQFNLTL
ncbi:asparagine synthase (glutamine-hydrolyzing) [Pseudomonas entomophila]|uniref:asparagine synthase (glutamine-hydrolyzing) n=2 Tax=Pseudomonas entomophila TaxID=312306 RepID=Q1I2K2_PSEE4|nr:asparagine synthase (glutamine-hydrolyzing) [Pseudomonas entomophila]WMW06182.1 asparagine synthase (glutamine-hydrolyzing) [Pseudomonas entomophila]CAK18134.1 putative Asparagine synthase (glutamine-hydrolyzing) [Pseudomonas entomophila L48]